MGIELSKKQIAKIIAKADQDGSGLIDFEEFLALIGDNLKTVCSEKKSLLDLNENEMYESAQAVFAEFDDDGSGSISTVELGNVFRKLGANPSEQDLQSLINEVDADGSGLIEFNEFLLLMDKLKKNFEET